MTVLLILGALSSVYLMWILIRLASLALPLYAAFGVGAILLANGVGLPFSLLGALTTGIATMVLGQWLSASTPSPIARLAVAVVFVLPAGIAGYHATYGLVGLFIDHRLALMATASVGALTAASMAWRSLAGGTKRA